MQSLGMRREGGRFWRDLKSWVGAKLLKAARMLWPSAESVEAVQSGPQAYHLASSGALQLRIYLSPMQPR